jgi:serine/threonine protein phosphatase PrpC
MSAVLGKRTKNYYPYSHNQLSVDNPFRVISSTFNQDKPESSYQNEQNNNNNISSNPSKLLNKPYERKGRTFSQDLISSDNYSKYTNKRYSMRFQNKDHIRDLFKNNYDETQNYYIESTNKKEDKPLIYSTYTTSKYRRKKENNNVKEIESNLNGEKISNIDFAEYYEENCNIIKSYAYKESQNIKYRDYMEDKGRSILNIKGDPDKALFCLFDGHGGDQVSKYLQNNFIKYFKEMLPFNNVNESLIKLFKNLDEKLKELNYYQVGATACIIYITKEKGQRVLYSANVGDTRSVLISKNDVKRLSYDHRADDKNEYKRIVNDGGIVFGGRVYGSLMLARSFGDWQLKSYGVSCEPHITRINITDKDKYVIVATDGIWDIFKDEDVFDISKKFDNSKELCNKLVYQSIEKGSMDNISCFVISL